MATESKKHTHPTINVTGADTMADKANEALHAAGEKASEAVEAVTDKANELMGNEEASHHAEHGSEHDKDTQQKELAKKPAEMECNLVIDEGVVEKIAFLATSKIDGIVEMKGNVLSMIQEGFGGNDRRKGADADIEGNGAAIDLSLILKYGTSAIDLFDQIREIVAKNIKEMTGLEVTSLTINVVDVMDDDEIAERNGGADKEQHVQKSYTRKVA